MLSSSSELRAPRGAASMRCGSIHATLLHGSVNRTVVLCIHYTLLHVSFSANLRRLGQGRGGQKTMCCWLQRWWSPSDGCSQRGPCSSSSTSHFAMLQEGDWEGHRALLGAEEMMLCSGCAGPSVPLWAKCPLYRLFHQHKGICLASHC